MSQRTRNGEAMAIGIYFAPTTMTAEKYDECIKLLKKAGVGSPVGRSYHAAFGEKDKLSVFDVWTSQAAFDKFAKKLMPIMQQLGVDPGMPSVMPVHKIILPAPKARTAAPKKQAKAPAPGKKSAKAPIAPPKKQGKAAPPRKKR
jgi:hypothetical protein